MAETEPQQEVLEQVQEAASKLNDTANGMAKQAQQLLDGDGTKIHLSFLKNKKVEELLLWRDVKKSGAVLAVATVVYYLLALSGMNLITIVAYVMLAMIVGAYVWANAGNMIKSSFKPETLLPSAFKEGLTEKDVQVFAEKYLDSINVVLSSLNRLLQGSDTVLSVKVMGALFLITQVVRYFSPLTLVYIAILIAFSVPKFYELNKDKCDEYLKLAHDKIVEVYSKINETVLKKIPKATDAKKES
eukprot:TRINITY_DN2218_c0_g1_i1.p2 TRINITY_DN2218_c0_g1~~TRINITY_DN2218_c0_g1_i1.p2  ORF type:complete len:245 (-),score=32.40 TRINITY_DN2218_c0_g1_i1:315-1049(-)